MANMGNELKELPEGDYYAISDYGYGDGACQGPLTAAEAVDKYKAAACCDFKNWTPLDIFKHAFVRYGHRPTHYISDEDRSDDFNSQSFQDS